MKLPKNFNSKRWLACAATIGAFCFAAACRDTDQEKLDKEKISKLENENRRQKTDLEVKDAEIAASKAEATSAKASQITSEIELREKILELSSADLVETTKIQTFASNAADSYLSADKLNVSISEYLSAVNKVIDEINAKDAGKTQIELSNAAIEKDKVVAKIADFEKNLIKGQLSARDEGSILVWGKSQKRKLPKPKSKLQNM